MRDNTVERIAEILENAECFDCTSEGDYSPCHPVISDPVKLAREILKFLATDTEGLTEKLARQVLLMTHGEDWGTISPNNKEWYKETYGRPLVEIATTILNGRNTKEVKMNNDLVEKVAQFIADELHTGEPTCEGCYEMANKIIPIIEQEVNAGYLPVEEAHLEVPRDGDLAETKKCEYYDCENCPGKCRQISQVTIDKILKDNGGKLYRIKE